MGLASFLFEKVLSSLLKDAALFVRRHVGTIWGPLLLKVSPVVLASLASVDSFPNPSLLLWWLPDVVLYPSVLWQLLVGILLWKNFPGSFVYICIDSWTPVLFNKWSLFLVFILMPRLCQMVLSTSPSVVSWLLYPFDKSASFFDHLLSGVKDVPGSLYLSCWP